MDTPVYEQTPVPPVYWAAFCVSEKGDNLVRPRPSTFVPAPALSKTPQGSKTDLFTNGRLNPSPAKFPIDRDGGSPAIVAYQRGEVEVSRFLSLLFVK